MKVKHIYYFSSYNKNGISTRYRGVYVLKDLNKQYGITNDFVYPGYRLHELYSFAITFIKALFDARNSSIVIFQKIYRKGFYTFLLKSLVKIRPKGTVYDTDDADYLRYYDKNIYFFMKNSQLCTVGSTFLENFAAKYNSNVVLLTSPVIAHNEIKKSRNKILHIGWIGHYGLEKNRYSHKYSLKEILFPALKEINIVCRFSILGVNSQKDKDEIISLFCECPNVFLDIPQKINWLNEESVYRLIKEFDLGVSPMLNHEFNKSKSAFKAKQYLSCGVPVLASPVGENPRFIKDGFNGYLCRNKEDFKMRILQFSNMTMYEYDTFRKNTRLNISHYSIERFCKDLITNLESF